jgi:hypothetical protein
MNRSDNIFDELDMREASVMDFLYPVIASVDIEEAKNNSKEEIEGLIYNLEKTRRHTLSLLDMVFSGYEELKISGFTPESTALIKSDLSKFAKQVGIDIFGLKRV